MLTSHTPQTGYLQLILTIHHSLYVVQSLSLVQLFEIPWIAAFQASPSFTISWNWLKLMSSESMMPSNHLILYCSLILLPLIFQSIRVFSNESAVCIWQSIGASASASGLPKSIQDWFPLGLIGLIPLLSKGLSRVFSSTTVGKHHFFSAQPSLCSSSHIHTWLLENSSFDYMDLCQQRNVSAF